MVGYGRLESLQKIEEPSGLSGVHELFALQLWKAANRLSRFLFCNSHIVQGLQVQPEPRARPKEMAEPQGRVAGDTARAVQDLCHAIGGHGNLSRQFRRAHFQRLQFPSQVLARMNCHYGHDCLLSIIHNLDKLRVTSSELKRLSLNSKPAALDPKAAAPALTYVRRC